MGMPMGMPAAPQIANLACYPVEARHAYALGPGKCSAICRYIDDIWSAGVPLPSQEDYGMSYTKTAEGASVVYLGVRSYLEEHQGKKELHLTVYDREEQYPYHIVRYPEFGSVVPRQQVGGVIMGRLVHCQETCTHMKDFKESVATVLRHAMWRGYARRLVQSVWSRFLFQRWHSTDVRIKELRVWFPKIWAYLIKSGDKRRPIQPTQSSPSEQTNGAASSSTCSACPLRTLVLLTRSKVSLLAKQKSSVKHTLPEAPLWTKTRTTFISSSGENRERGTAP
jgi:hypothetical protein